MEVIEALTQSKLRRLGGLLREVAVIVVGVSVALGADAMYERQRDKAERDRILRSFRADLRLDSAEFASAFGPTEGATSRLLAMIDNPSAVVDPIDLAAALRESIFYPGGLKEAATYREVTATGRISLIEDEALRGSLLRYYARSFTGLPPEMWAAYVADVHGAYERTLRRHLGSAFLELVQCRSRATDYEACLTPPSARIDLAALRADPDFVEGLVGMALWAGRFGNLIGRQRGLHEALVGLVDEAIGER